MQVAGVAYGRGLRLRGRGRLLCGLRRGLLCRRGCRSGSGRRLLLHTLRSCLRRRTRGALRAGSRSSLALRNLLNEQYEVVQGYPMPGFNVLATVEYVF